MAALSRCTVRSLKTKRCLISSLGGSHLPKRSREVTLVLSLGSLQVAQRTYCSPVKETSEEDLKNRPIRFSTSRARSMTVGQTLGERKKSTSMVTVYVSLTIMVILTYIIFFLPPNKQDEEALDILNSSMVANEQDKGQ